MKLPFFLHRIRNRILCRLWGHHWIEFDHPIVGPYCGRCAIPQRWLLVHPPKGPRSALDHWLHLLQFEATRVLEERLAAREKEGR
jgi:hypothetical protein